MNRSTRAALGVALGLSFHAPVALRAAPATLRFTVEAETVERIGVETTPLVATEERATTTAFARVLDPAQLAALDSEIRAARAALDASGAEAERLRLLRVNEDVSARVHEAAKAQLAADQARLDEARRRLAFGWGAEIQALDDAARGRLVDRLVSGKAVLVRVELPAGLAWAGAGGRGEIVLATSESDEHAIAARGIGTAPAVDAQLQSRGLLVEALTQGAVLPVGSALVARLSSGAPPERGVTVPTAALVRRGGALWAYVQLSDTEFERRPVEAGRVVPGGRFVTGGFAAGERVVSAGVADLLAAEQAPPPGAEPAEDDDD